MPLSLWSGLHEMTGVNGGTQMRAPAGPSFEATGEVCVIGIVVESVLDKLHKSTVQGVVFTQWRAGVLMIG